MKNIVNEQDFDNVMNWIYDHAEDIIPQLNLKKPYSTLSKHRRALLTSKHGVIYADVQFRFKFEYRGEFIVDFIIDVDLYSIKDILGKINLLKSIFNKPESFNPHKFVVVSRNDRHIEIFKQERILFIKSGV